MDDEKLLQLLQQDPDAGMECLMDRYAGLLYTVVRDQLSACGCVSSDIEDCVADVFSEFYTSLSSYDPKISSIKSYLAVLARNNATDILRKRRTSKLNSSGEETELEIWLRRGDQTSRCEIRSGKQCFKKQGVMRLPWWSKG